MDNIKKLNDTPKIVNQFYVVIAVIKILLDWHYYAVVSVMYAYAGFINEVTLYWQTLSWIILIFSLPIFKKYYQNTAIRISNEIILFFYLLAFVPFTTMVGFGGFRFDFVIANLIYWVMFILYVKLLDYIHVGRNVAILVTNRYKSLLFNILTLISCATIFYISGKYAHFRLNFSLSNVYDLRYEARTFKLPVLLNYAYSFTNTINVIALVYFLKRKNLFWVVFITATQLFRFGIDGSKSSLFITIIVLGINFLPRLKPKNFNRVLLLGFLSVMLISLGEFYIRDKYFLGTLFVRRLLFLPNLISSYYFDFFTKNIPDFFRGSILRRIGLVSPYPPIARMVGDVYFGNFETNANAGLIADAVANLGYVGIFIMPFPLVVILKWLDSITKEMDLTIFVIVALKIVIPILSTFLSTAFLSGGVFVAMIMLSLLPSNASEKSRSTIPVSR